MNWFVIYLWTRLDTIQALLCMGTVITGVTWAICLLCWIMASVDGQESDVKKIKPFTKRVLLWLVVFVIPFSLTPSSKDFAMIYAIPKIIDSKAIKQDLPEIYDMAIKQLKKKIIDKEGGE